MTQPNLQPATDNSLNLRPATETDIPQILQFIRDLAEYEREPDAVLATEADLLRDGFTEPHRFHCIIAELNQNGAPIPAGFALYFYNYSTWRGHSGIYRSQHLSIRKGEK